MNKLFYGDNLDILRRYIGDETVDLIYLDPPFNSNATYNVLFSQQNGTQSSAQILTIEELLAGAQIDMPPIRQVN